MKTKFLSYPPFFLYLNGPFPLFLVLLIPFFAFNTRGDPVSRYYIWRCFWGKKIITKSYFFKNLRHQYRFHAVKSFLRDFSLIHGATVTVTLCPLPLKIIFVPFPMFSIWFPLSHNFFVRKFFWKSLSKETEEFYERNFLESLYDTLPNALFDQRNYGQGACLNTQIYFRFQQFRKSV